MKRILDYLLLSLIVCLFSCGEEHCKLDKEVEKAKEVKEKITMPQLKKVLGNSIFRYEEPKDDGTKHLNCLQIMTFFDESKKSSDNIANQGDYVQISRDGNEARLEGYEEWYKEYISRKTYDLILAETCFVSFEETSSQLKVVGQLESNDDGIGSPMHEFWGNDVVWIKYNATKDVLEVKLKTPLTGKKAGPIVYELKRVQNDITDTWV